MAGLKVGRGPTVARIYYAATIVFGVADNVVALRIRVHLIAAESVMRRDHPRRSVQPEDARMCHTVFL